MAGYALWALRYQELAQSDKISIMFSKRIAIDLGAANTRVYIPKKGLVANEPSVVAISVEDNRIANITPAIGQSC